MYSTGAAAKILASTVKLPYLEVCHLAVTFDTAGGQFVITIYLNGTSIATQTFASSSVQSLTGLGLYVGGYPATQFQLGDANGTTTIYGAQVAQGVASAGTLATRAATFTPLAG